MNILYEQFPEAIEIDGVEYPINSDYRTCLRIIKAYESSELTTIEKHIVMLELLYKKQPENKTEAIIKGIKFLNCGMDYKADELQESEHEARIFSFKQDAQYIFTAINKSHRIDISNIDNLHWWKFCYMFSDINEDTMFSRIIDLRNRKKLGKLTKEEKEYYARNKKTLELTDIYSPEIEMAKEKFLKLFGKG